MAYILTPRFVPTYQPSQGGHFGFCAPISRPTCSYRVNRPQPPRRQYSSFNHFFTQVNELLGEIDREALRQAQHEAHLEALRDAHRQRQRAALRAQFAVSQTEHGWQVDGDMRGFEQENVTIEITDENTLKIAGNTHWQSENSVSENKAAPALEQPIETTADDTMDGITLNEPGAEQTTETETFTESQDSDTESHKSYQATVEDDFEDLGADAASLISTPSNLSTIAEPQEPKGKGKALSEHSPTDVAEVPSEKQQEQPQKQERVHGSFERTFRFPERIDAANVSASFKEGALKITVPRAQIQQTKRVVIS